MSRHRVLLLGFVVLWLAFVTDILLYLGDHAVPTSPGSPSGIAFYAILTLAPVSVAAMLWLLLGSTSVRRRSYGILALLPWAVAGSASAAVAARERHVQNRYLLEVNDAMRRLDLLRASHKACDSGGRGWAATTPGTVPSNLTGVDSLNRSTNSVWVDSLKVSRDSASLAVQGILRNDGEFGLSVLAARVEYLSIDKKVLAFRELMWRDPWSVAARSARRFGMNPSPLPEQERMADTVRVFLSFCETL